ncbi:hypothetical protein ACFQ44_06960 [Levilactobacillus lanxiensis]|uniref:Uncharacterized protein n=1 Tax=Levilactobacillus lanxiensis TaxID=2799568 RepID=A0ABW4D3V4_9LACO|nr:hypothetical protein [Levilactobacillus lanxiensis]
MNKYRHFIALARLKDGSFAYHFSTTDDSGREIQRVWGEVLDASSVPAYFWGVHVLGTDGAGFDSVQQMDPYFRDVEPIEDLAVFVKRLEVQSKDGFESMGVMGM